MRKYIVNNKEVEYLHIEEKPDGTTIVSYEEKFNIVNAHMSVIMEKLREEGLGEVHVFKDLQHGIISILLDDINHAHGAIHCLSIPHLSYDLLVEDKTIIVDVPLLEKALEQELSTAENSVKYAYEKG